MYLQLLTLEFSYSHLSNYNLSICGLICKQTLQLEFSPENRFILSWYHIIWKVSTSLELPTMSWLSLHSCSKCKIDTKICFIVSSTNGISVINGNEKAEVLLIIYMSMAYKYADLLGMVQKFCRSLPQPWIENVYKLNHITV